MSTLFYAIVVVVIILVALYMMGKIKFENGMPKYVEGYATKSKEYVDLIGNSVIGLGVTAVGPEYAYRLMDSRNPQQYVNLSR